MKLLEIIAIVTCIAGLLLGACDSESMAWFMWSKVVAAWLLGVSIFLIHFIKGGNGEIKTIGNN